MKNTDHAARFDFRKEEGDWTAAERRDLIDAVLAVIQDVNIVVNVESNGRSVSVNGAAALRLSCPSPLGPVLSMNVDVRRTDEILSALRHDDSADHKTDTPRLDAFFEKIQAMIQPDPIKRAAAMRAVDAEMEAKNHERFFASLTTAVTESLKSAIPVAMRLSGLPSHSLAHSGRPAGDASVAHRSKGPR